MIVRNEIVDPATLDESAIDALVTALYSVHTEIFDGVSREEFARYVVKSPAKKTRIQLSYGENGELAGYLAMHAFRPTLRAEECTVLRAEAGLRRAYRGNASTAGFAISNLLATKWEYSGPLFYLGCLVHPSSYTIFANNAPAVWPAPGVEIPEELLDLMMRLGEEFHLEMVDPARPLVRKVGWITRDTEAERRYWQSCDLPGATFYLEQNPGYVNGHGLLTLLPLDPLSTAKLVFNTGASRLKKAVHRAVGRIERDYMRRKLDALTAEELLATIEDATGLELDAVRQRGLLGNRFPLSSRQTLFRAGERADALYVVVEGSLFVMGNGPDGDIVMDQLGANSIVGELEMMTGETHSFTVRAAIDSVLLRLTRDDLAKLFSAEPRLEDALWGHIHGRVLGSLRRNIPTLRALSRADCESWFAAAMPRVLDENECFSAPARSVVVLSQGKLLVDNNAQMLSFSAPSLIQIQDTSTITAAAKSRFAVLPDLPGSSNVA